MTSMVSLIGRRGGQVAGEWATSQCEDVQVWPAQAYEWFVSRRGKERTAPGDTLTAVEAPREGTHPYFFFRSNCSGG